VKDGDRITIRDLSVHYETLEALIRVSMDIESGQLTLLVGPNGAGKTTLLGAISGLLYDRIKRKALFDEELGASGSIRLGGEEILHLPPHERVKRHIAHCPEKRGLLPEMTVLENLLLGAYLRRDREGIKQDLERNFVLFPQLKKLLQKEVGFLSGGEQQMVAIGRALMASPKYLLMDEPMAGLAPGYRTQLKEIIASLRDEGIGILLTEQNSKAVLEVGEKIYIIGRGTIAFEGSRDEVMSDEYILTTYFGI